MVEKPRTVAKLIILVYKILFTNWEHNFDCCTSSTNKISSQEVSRIRVEIVHFEASETSFLRSSSFVNFITAKQESHIKITTFNASLYFRYRSPRTVEQMKSCEKWLDTLDLWHEILMWLYNIGVKIKTNTQLWHGTSSRKKKSCRKFTDLEWKPTTSKQPN
jgi:hypothetical protein